MRGKQSSLIQWAGVAALAAAGMSACESDFDYTAPPVTVRPPAVPANVEAAVPANFLVTEFAPLQRWMSEPFEIEYRNMTPELIFEQDPIADIRYDTRNLPENAPLFELKSAGISRREILYRVAEFWDLDMSIQAEGGTPSYVLVTGKPTGPPREDPALAE